MTCLGDLGDQLLQKGTWVNGSKIVQKSSQMEVQPLIEHKEAPSKETEVTKVKRALGKKNVSFTEVLVSGSILSNCAQKRKEGWSHIILQGEFCKAPHRGGVRHLGRGCMEDNHPTWVVLGIQR